MQFLKIYFVGWKTVGHIPREISRYVYFFIKKGGVVTGKLNSLTYKPSPIPSGGLEVPLLLRFRCDVKWTIETMKKFVEQYYNFDFYGTLITSPQDDDNDECEDFEVVTLDNEDAKASNAVNDEEERFDWDLSVEMPVANIISSETDRE